jgi:hypothetical protein
MLGKNNVSVMCPTPHYIYLDLPLTVPARNSKGKDWRLFVDAPPPPPTFLIVRRGKRRAGFNLID